MDFVCGSRKLEKKTQVLLNRFLVHAKKITLNKKLILVSVCRLNSTVECIPYHLQLTPENALQLIQQYPPAAAFTCQ